MNKSIDNLVGLDYHLKLSVYGNISAKDNG